MNKNLMNNFFILYKVNCLFSEEELRQADEVIHKYEIERLKDKIKCLESSAEFYKYQSERLSEQPYYSLIVFCSNGLDKTVQTFLPKVKSENVLEMEKKIMEKVRKIEEELADTRAELAAKMKCNR